MMYHSRFRLESPDVVVVLADAGRHHGGQHGASHGGKGEVPVQVSQNASLNISWKMFVCFSSELKYVCVCLLQSAFLKLSLWSLQPFKEYCISI